MLQIEGNGNMGSSEIVAHFHYKSTVINIHQWKPENLILTPIFL